jgi:hypothetical protein
MVNGSCRRQLLPGICLSLPQEVPMATFAEPITFQTVRAIGLQLPGTEQGTAYGSPALKVNGEMFACIPVNRSVEPDTLAVRVPFEQRDDLLTEAPDIYYLTDHYVDHPIVLVRLSRVRRDALGDLLRMAHRFAASEKRTLRKSRRRPVGTRRRH